MADDNRTLHGERSHRSVMRSDSGLDLTSDFWMHRHFRAMAALYSSLLGEAGLLPGDRVLDLGCGSGTHFEWIANLIGPEGRIVGFDSDEENLVLARNRIAGKAYSGQIELRQGPIGMLPFDNGEFDAVWCAGTLQYVPEPVDAIREMVRVVRPGGRVAAQDVEMHSMLLGPMPDELLLALKGSLPNGWTGADQHEFVDWFVGHKLRGYFIEAGLREVRGVMRTREYIHPLTDDERGFLDVAIPYLCTESPGIDNLPVTHARQLQSLVDAANPGNLVNRSEFIFVEGRAMAVGVR
jgi:ubiquinone/menaquinone biosynthesis C-methylase UbiE